MSEPVTRTSVEQIRAMLDAASILQCDASPLVSVAGERTRAILVELLMEVAPDEIPGPWHDLV